MNHSKSLNQTFLSLIFFFYVVFPILFYGIPLAYIVLEDINLNVHWYVDFSINKASLFQIFLIHFFLGVGVYLIAQKILSSVEFKTSNNAAISFLIISCLIFQFFPSSYIKLVSFLLIIICISNIKLNTRMILIFFFFSMLSLFMLQDRELFVFSSLLAAVILRLSITQIFVLAALGLIFLSMVLEPLKYGMSPIGFYSENNGFLYLLMHLQPIFVSSFFFLDYSQNFFELFAEGIPFLKGILDIGSVSFAEDFSKYDANIDLDFGSNSSMYANINGYIVCSIYLAILIVLINFSKEFSLSFLFYILLMGPSFIRRSFGSYFVDLLIIFLLICFFFALYRLFKNFSQIRGS